MEIITDYFNHILHRPEYYQRNFEHDFPEEVPQWLETGKRVGLLALPFIALYRPAGQVISVGMGATRTITEMRACILASQEQKYAESSLHLCMAALAVTSIAATVFDFTLGTFVTTFADIGMSLYRAGVHINDKDYINAVEELMQAASSSLYIAILLTGSYEIMLASALLQVAVCIYQSVGELKQERYPEFAAKLAMGVIRLHTAYGHFEMIRERNRLLASEKYQTLMQQIKKGNEVFDLIFSPLHKDGEEVIFVDPNGNEYNFGEQVHGYGQGLVKGMNLKFSAKVVDGKEMNCLEFKVNHVFRTRLDTLIKGLQEFDQDELSQFLKLSRSHIEGIKIERIPFIRTENGTFAASKITLEGVGSLIISESPEVLTLYNKIQVELESNKTLFDWHELLSFFNLEQAIRPSSSSDLERLKIGQLFRIFHPKEATKLERTDEFFDLPINDLKNEMIAHAPDMEEKFETLLPTFEALEILPGRMRYALPCISKMAYEAGARALFSTLTSCWRPEEAADRLASILTTGMLSSEIRFSHGMNVEGLSSFYDFFTGGADSVYTQILTDAHFKEKTDLDSLCYSGNVRILFSLDPLNFGTYQFYDDSFGSRIMDYGPYVERPNILELVDYLVQFPQYGWNFSNEVMSKDRIDPSFIKGITVSDERYKTIICERLRSLDVISSENTIRGVPVDQFIHVGHVLSEEMIA